MTDVVQVRTKDGIKEIPCLGRWKKTIDGEEFEFALHVAPTKLVGQRPLLFSEVSTGHSAQIAVRHPSIHSLLTEAHLRQGHEHYCTARKVNRAAAAALHNGIKSMDGESFRAAVGVALMAIANKERANVLENGAKPAVVEEKV